MTIIVGIGVAIIVEVGIGVATIVEVGIGVAILEVGIGVAIILGIGVAIIGVAIIVGIGVAIIVEVGIGVAIILVVGIGIVVVGMIIVIEVAVAVYWCKSFLSFCHLLQVNLAVNLGKSMIPLLMENSTWPPPGSMGPIFSEYLFIRFFTRPGETACDDRYWAKSKFQELLMQLSYNKVLPDETRVAPGTLF